ncbi:2689_t:CDS:2 [Scutellospora calospora]|uniref:2689_t:CDS:1 n=1 Tax=Scutellospora calospora TaxID=85575 RepID=A0ACA9KGI2_9GLOM|nr:2689_t:CDS:2 [Scutellospora calospora]
MPDIYAVQQQPKPQRLSDKEMRQLLTNLKKEADKSPEEKGSFGLEVICSGKDMESNNYNWYGRTRLGKEEIGGLKSDIPNFNKLFGFRKLVNTIAHELAHCLMANYKLQFGYKHDKSHGGLTQDIEAFLWTLPEIKELERLQGFQ